jgi:hypothetical protein
MKPYLVDPGLKQFASEAQTRYIEAIEQHGSIKAAAEALGLNPSGLSHALARLERNAAMRNYSPTHGMTHPVPEPFTAKRVSTLRDADGNVKAQWVIATQDQAQVRAAMEAAAAAMSEELPRLGPTAKPDFTRPDLCNVYTMTDCHMGMLAWHKESGADWDVKIAERVLSGCFEHMVRSSPAAGTGVVAQLGDFLHSDGLLPLTPTSHNVLDQDGRFSKIVQASVRVLRRMVDFALQHHEHVVVLMAEGNHDMASSVWLRAMFQALYENEPRVTVIDSEKPYYVHQHGKTMLAWHHGHLKKINQLPLFFAAEYPAVWGATTKRYCHTGHQHHTDEKEHAGMSVHQHPTLAARDAYASRKGYVAERQVTSITYHAEYGQVARNTVTPEMLEMVQLHDTPRHSEAEGSGDVRPDRSQPPSV